MDRKTVMIFGVGELQRSIILKAKSMGFFVVGIDPCEEACCKDDVDAFEVVGGADYEKTLEAARKYGISAVATAATDKPMIMMARIASALGLRFFSEDTARWSTDKFLMKERFREYDVPCAEGRLVRNIEETEGLCFPVICKPRDNSGSRGVRLCRDSSELKECIEEALQHSRLDTVLVEEFIEGQEYSIESLHHDGITEIIQFTEKKTTPFPYNVELEHIQPAQLGKGCKEEISKIISRTAEALRFENCPSHTELKINDRGIFIIETSPRLGGDYITSTLVPLSTGINMEEMLLNISTGKSIDTVSGRKEQSSGVRFHNLGNGIINRIGDEIRSICTLEWVDQFRFTLNEGDLLPKISSSLQRYGEVIVHSPSYEQTKSRLSQVETIIRNNITIQI